MPHELTITIPGNILPVERGKCYTDPLNEALKKAGVGATGDEGTQLGLVDGKLVVVAAHIEVSVTELDEGLAAVRRILKELGAPDGTTITQYEPAKVVHQLS